MLILLWFFFMIYCKFLPLIIVRQCILGLCDLEARELLLRERYGNGVRTSTSHRSDWMHCISDLNHSNSKQRNDSNHEQALVKIIQ